MNQAARWELEAETLERCAISPPAHEEPENTREPSWQVHPLSGFSLLPALEKDQQSQGIWRDKEKNKDGLC